MRAGDVRKVYSHEGETPEGLPHGTPVRVVGPSQSRKDSTVVDHEGELYDIPSLFLMNRDAYVKLADWWNDHIDLINQHIQEGKHRNHTFFHWDQLVWQELAMWVKLDKKVTRKDLDFIVNRRGFSPVQEEFLIESLKHIGFWLDAEDESAVHSGDLDELVDVVEVSALEEDS